MHAERATLAASVSRQTLKNMAKTVLVIGAVWPESNSSAAGQNMSGLLRAFYQHNFSIVFASAAADSQHADDVSEYDVTNVPISINDDAFDDMISELQPDVVVFDRYMTEEQFSWRVRKHCPQALHLLNTEDLHSLRYARHDAVKRTGSADNAELNNALAHREIAAILRSDISLVISSYEYALLVNTYQVPAQQLILLPLQPPVIKDNTESLKLDFAQRQHFMTVGNFRHAPNWDSVLQLHQHIWPAIRKQLPHAELHIYGAYPPKKATALHNPKSGFLVKGWVDDVDLVMAQSRVCIAPLRFGAGVKGKLLTALLHQTPSVTTPIGAEGIATHENWPGAVESDHDAFVQAAVELYTNESRWQQASNRCPALFSDYKTSVINGNTALFAQIELACNDIAAYRAPLLQQGMVWHHSLRSTQFMSQWIEAKNRL